MFFQLLFIHLYRPFLKYTRSTSPLPAHVSPRKFCTQAAGAISKLLRLYKRTHGLRQICNIAVYIAHSACTIHILNLPDKNAKRDIIHGVKHLEEIGECWTCARRTLRMLSISAQKWKIDLPEEVAATFQRTNMRWGTTDMSTSPASAGGFADLSPQSQSNSQTAHSQQALQDRHSNVQQPPHNQSSIPHLNNGLFPALAPSPASEISDPRRTSGSLSLPPQNASEMSRNTNRIRPSTYLTQAQQDAWNAHQARFKTTQAENSSAPQNANAAVLFGGVDSLVEESQDWWLKDQSALALGFDNWVDGSTDWAGLGLSPANNAYPNANGDSANGGFNSTSPTINGAVGGFMYSEKPAVNGWTAYPAYPSQDAKGGGMQHQHSKSNSFDDEMYF